MQSSALCRISGCWLACFLAGCSAASEWDRLPLYGKLNVASLPPEQFTGSFSLVPLKGTLGPAANTAIRQGAYRFTTLTGPVPGKYRATVTTLPGGSKLDSLPKSAGKSKPASQPARSHWTFDVEITADALEQDFDVDKLASPPQPREKSASRSR